MKVLDSIRILRFNIIILAFLSTLLTISAHPYQTGTVPSKNLTNTSYRLPNTTIPSKYYIDIEIPEDALNGKNVTFNGFVKIRFTVTKPSDTIYLNGFVRIWNITLTDNDKIIPALKYLKNTTTEILMIVFKNKLVISGNYSLIICYSGDLMTDIIKGVSRIKYTEDRRTKYLIATQFQPTYARYAFPCFDEPLYKATFILKISYPIGYTAMSNRPEKETIVRNNTKITVFQETQKMSTYLLAFSVSKLTCSKSDGNVSLKVCSRDKFVDDRSFALNHGLKLINAMNSWTNFNYSEGNSKLDQFAIPGITELAMENWGFVTYHEFMLLWNKAEASSELTQASVETIAHELSHQWFGNLVTTSWWDTLFLNEGFATYFQHYLLNLIGLEYLEMEKQLIIKQQQVAFVEDAHIDSSALTSDVSTVDEIEDKFGTISYSKGASVIKMIENVIGPNNFKKSLRVYLKKNAFDVTTPEKLWDSLGSFIKKRTLPENLTFSEFITNWTNKGGFPLVTAVSNGNDVILTQKRFLYDGESNDQWYVPVTYLSSKCGTAETVWLKPHSNVTIKSVIDNDGWIVVNHNSRGYYRVKYDDVLYNRLTEALKTNALQFTDLDRAQIVDDTFNLAMAGQITYIDLFKIIKFLKNETSYYPWDAAIRGFNDIKVKFEDNSQLIGHIDHVLLDLIHGVANNVSLVNWDTIDHVSSLKLPVIWLAACQTGQKDCVSETRRLFGEFRNQSKSINPNIRQVVYCNALRYNGDATDWKFLWNRFLTTDQPHERIYILTSLGCTTNKDLLTFYLDASINILTPFEFEIVWDSVYRNGFIGLDKAFNYFLENHSVIFKYANEYAVGVFSNIIERLITDDQVKKLEKFIDELDEEDSEIKTFAEEILKSTKRNLKIKSRIKIELEKYFGIHPSVVTHL